MKPTDPKFEAWFASRLKQNLDRLPVTTPERQGQVQGHFPFGRNSMSLTPLVAVLKSQVAVIAATLVVGVSAIGMATTGSPNPKVWGADLMGSIQRSAPTTTTTTPTPTPEGTPTSGTPLTINSAASPEPRDTPEAVSSPEPTDTPEASASPEPRETPEAVASPEPRETPEPTATPESNGGDGSGDD